MKKNNQNLKKLSRAELLELLLVQTRENERLRTVLSKAEALLVDRHLRVTMAGDLASAVVEVNGVMAAAQAAAQQYLDNIQFMEQQTQETCSRLIQEARQEARQIRENALNPSAGIPGDQSGDVQ